MNVFLTSFPLNADGTINESNDFLWNIKYSLSYETNALFVASSPKDHIVNVRFADQIKNAFNSSGIFFKSMDILDEETKNMIKEQIGSHNLIILAGGHVPTQNAFFKEIDLKNKLDGYDGCILGISAGSMNSADEVYAIPEEEGEVANSNFSRFITGLGLTKIQIIPHYESTMDSQVDGSNIGNLIKADSRGRKFLGLPDGSYLMSTDGHELVYGPFFTVENGNITKTEAGFMAKSFD